MAVPSFSIRCLRSDIVATDVYEIACTKPDGLSFAAGQFVLFDVPLAENPADIQPRAYSIASAPHEEELLFIIKLVPGGRASRWIAESLKPGDDIRIQGPFGAFVLHPEREKEYLFVGTGTGVAPYRSHLMDLQKKGFAGRIDLVFGVRQEGDLFWIDELQRLAQTYEPFFLHPTLTDASPAWTGHRGRVQTLIPLIAKELSGKSVYVCGSPAMVADLKKLCREDWGIAKENFHAEAYV